MARLPDIQDRPTPRPAGGVAQYQSVEGQGLLRAAEIVERTNNEQDDIVATAAANRLHEESNVLEFDTDKGFRNKKEGAAVGNGFVDTYREGFGDAARKIRDGLENDNQRRLFDRRAEIRGLQFKAALLSHQAEQTDRFNDTTANHSLELALRDMAQRPNNEMAFQQGLIGINATIDGIAKRKGRGPDDPLTKDMKAKYLEAAYTARITSLMHGIPGVVEADPAKAQEMFKQVQHLLGPQSQTALAQKVASAVQESVLDTEARKVLGDSAGGKVDMQLALPDKLKQARARAQEMYPNDPGFADKLEQRVGHYAQRQIAEQGAEQNAAFDYIMGRITGDPYRGGVQTMKELLATPQDRAAWDKLKPQTQHAVQQQMGVYKKDGEGTKLTAESFDTYYKLLGMASKDDKRDFLAVNLSDYFRKIPDHLLLQLSGIQKSVSLKDAETQAKAAEETAKGVHYKRAFDAAKDMFDPVLAAVKHGDATKTKVAKEEMDNLFKGKLRELVDREYEVTGKWPDDKRSRELASGLLARVKIDSGWALWPDSEGLAFQQESMKGVYVPMPPTGSPHYAALVEEYARTHAGRVPTHAELTEAVTKAVIAGKLKPEWIKK